MMNSNSVFPFSAIVGQEQLKLALILNAINPHIGGVLIRGEKGTAKSTTVRALAAILPETQIVTLPLNATEDRVAGGINFNLAVKSGARVLQPGLLAKAHQGILYVDEVNLLDDHIVDIILDASASGENRIEREGISFSHPSAFVLVGTMNPEEGELRPQLLDRFGLCVEVASEKDLEKRILLMVRREAYDADPEAFLNLFQADNTILSDRIMAARKGVGDILVPVRIRHFIASLCAENNVAGHRADLVIEQAAKALAAYQGKSEVGIEEVKQVAGFVLVHRKRDPVPPPPPQDHSHDHETKSKEKDEDQETSHPEPEETSETSESDGERDQTDNTIEENKDDQASKQEQSAPEPQEKEGEQDKKDVLEKIFEVGETFKVKKITSPKDRIFRRGSGKRSQSRTAAKQGRYVRSTLPKGSHDIAFDATLRAAAPFQLQRKNNGHLSIILKDQDIREKIREKRMGNFLLFLVDASASMGARGRMAASKGAIMSLLLDAYQKRDKVTMVTFRKNEAFVNLAPTSSVELAGRLLSEMPVGGRTPLSSGLVKGFELLRNHLIREPEARPIAIIITDGRGNVSLGNKKPFQEAMDLAGRIALEDRIQFIVVDSESQGAVSFGLAQKLAGQLNAEYFKIQDLKANQLVDIVKGGVL